MKKKEKKNHQKTIAWIAIAIICLVIFAFWLSFFEPSKIIEKNKATSPLYSVGQELNETLKDINQELNNNN